MKRAISSFLAIVLIVASFAGCGKLFGEKPVLIVCPQDASVREMLGAREIRRYIYQRTGQLLEIIREGTEKIPKRNDLIVVSVKDRPIVQMLAEEANFKTLLPLLDPEHYLLRTIHQKKRRVLLITGGDTLGTLYGVYRFAEHLGIRFYLHGDVIPDHRIEFKLPDLNEDAMPLFAIRGIQPFHDFPEGPDWWNPDDYKAILSQLSRMRMNFFGLHCYPEGGVGPEPAVWIGLNEDHNDDGTVKFGYPSRWFTTIEGEKFDYSWGYSAKETSDFVHGASELFEHDVYGSDIMLDHSPVPETPEGYKEVFYRAGNLLAESFDYARMLGIKTCVGTETPLTIPALLRERLRKQGKNPDDISVIQELYEGMFSRIKKTHNLDYYWFWTPESWIWGGNTEDDITATTNDLLAAVKAVEKVDAPFTLATSGWVLGPQSDRALFDNILPGDMAMSCISRFLGFSPVDNAFGNIQKRPKWAIPWVEDDPNLAMPQLWAGRMRADAVDALKYKCTGLIGIHWRTRILGPNMSALARAAWNQRNFREKPPGAGPIGENVDEFTRRWQAIDKSIAGTDDDTLYQTVRHELSAYRLEIPNGTYTVTLKFCEHQHENKGYRIFNIKIQDKTVLRDLDIFAEAGKYTALDYRFENIKVTDGWVVIDFIRKFDYPTLAAISVEGDDYSRKINAGGPEYRDYAADWKRAQPRDLETDDFYDDWVLYQFGPEAASEISKLFQKLDGRLPRPSRWTNGPGNLYPDSRTWEEVSKEYEFVSDFEKLRPHIKGSGNLERFDYWLNNFRYMKAAARLNCAWGRFNETMEQVKAVRDSKTKAALAKETVLPIYKEMLQIVEELYRFLLATVNTSGEMGTVANMDSHTLPLVLDETGKELSKTMGEKLPEDAYPSKQYTGEARIIVPTVRTCIKEDENLKLKVIILDGKPPKLAELFWRQMGKDKFKSISLEHINRGVYSVQLPPEALRGEDIEYYVKVVTAENKELLFPATAPEINQTVVVIPGDV